MNSKSDQSHRRKDFSRKAAAMVLSFTPRRMSTRPAPANDDLPPAAIVGNVALALRGIFPNVSPAQAEGAARDLLACVRPGANRILPRRVAH